jgi:hypothetical protein
LSLRSIFWARSVFVSLVCDSEQRLVLHTALADWSFQWKNTVLSVKEGRNIRRIWKSFEKRLVASSYLSNHLSAWNRWESDRSDFRRLESCTLRNPKCSTPTLSVCNMHAACRQKYSAYESKIVSASFFFPHKPFFVKCLRFLKNCRPVLWEEKITLE